MNTSPAPSEPVGAAAAEAERDRLEALVEQLGGVHAGSEVGTVVAGLLDAACAATGAEFGLYIGVDSEDQPPVIVRSDAEVTFALEPSPAEAPLLAASLSGGPALRVDDTRRWALSEEAARPYGSLRGLGQVRSYLACSVASPSGALLGGLFLGHHEPRAFGVRQERLVSTLAAHLGAALDKASLLAEHAEVATRLQETLLPPRLPAMPGIDAWSAYRPMGAINVVGGDFYDVFASGDGAWDVVLGDVSGVGPEAAALTGLARYTVRAVAAAGADAPSAVLTALNDALNNQRATERFCTAVYLRLRPTPSGVSVVLANGGHPPALVLRDGGQVEEVDGGGGLPLGLFDDPLVVDRPLSLAPGDALVLYTDGVIEARAPGSIVQFGQERVEGLLATSVGRTAQGIARRLELAVIDYQGGETRDDIAVLVLRARPG